MIGRVRLLQTPAFPVFVVQQVVGLRQIRDFEVGAVPEQLVTAITNANRAEQNRLGERTGKVKIRARRRPAFARIHPFLVMTR